MKQITPAQHFAERREVSPALRQIHVQPVSAPLYVVCAMFNPLRFWSRYKLYHRFRKHCEDAGAFLYTVELALRDRHFEVTDFNCERDIQLRGPSEIWYKENLQDVGVTCLPGNAEYVAFVDGDFHFTRADWATETVQMLQHYEAVQMFSHVTNETHDHRPLGTNVGFAYAFRNNHEFQPGYTRFGAPGGAWAFRRTALQKIGGMLDTCILGSGDYHMAIGLCGLKDAHQDWVHEKEMPAYFQSIRNWQDRAAVLKGNVGYVEAHAIHGWHGPMAKRGYMSRGGILARNHYDPGVDVMYDENGVLQLTGNKPQLRDDIRRYFKTRNEDEISI